jgi:hypothetical protein
MIGEKTIHLEERTSEAICQRAQEIYDTEEKPLTFMFRYGVMEAGTLIEDAYRMWIVANQEEMDKAKREFLERIAERCAPSEDRLCKYAVEVKVPFRSDGSPMISKAVSIFLTEFKWTHSVKNSIRR